MSITKIEELRTDDLAMASYLNLKGYQHHHIQMKDRRSCEWIFDAKQPGLAEAAEVYQRADALVEPLEFNTVLRRVRDELYQFLRSNRR